MLTTAGNTFFTTGANELRLGPSPAFANFSDAGGLMIPSCSAPLTASPPNPTARARAITAALGRRKKPCVLIYPPNLDSLDHFPQVALPIRRMHKGYGSSRRLGIWRTGRSV